MENADRPPDEPRPQPAGPDAALRAALEADGGVALDRAELASRSGLPVTVVEALERQGLLQPGPDGGYAETDIEVLAAGRVLLEAGVPLGELLDLAKQVDGALRPVATEAVETFVRFVRDPTHATSSDDEAARRLTTAFEQMLPAARRLVGEHFARLVVDQARRRLEDELAAGDVTSTDR